MTSGEVTKIINTAAKVLVKKKSIHMLFEKDTIRIKLPTTRELAKELNVQHYYVLPGFSLMEDENLVTREERVGIWTTKKGTEILLSIMKKNFSKETEDLIGEEIFHCITEKSNHLCDDMN